MTTSEIIGALVGGGGLFLTVIGMAIKTTRAISKAETEIRSDMDAQVENLADLGQGVLDHRAAAIVFPMHKPLGAKPFQGLAHRHARDQHHAPVGGVLLVLSALY